MIVAYLRELRVATRAISSYGAKEDEPISRLANTTTLASQDLDSSSAGLRGRPPVFARFKLRLLCGSASVYLLGT